METGKRRTLLSLMMNVFILSTVPSCSDGQSTEQVIDLLAALNMSQPIKGISKIHSEDPSGTTKTFKLRPKAPHLTLPPEFSRLLVSSGPLSLGVHLVGRQAPDSFATLLSLSSGSRTLLRLVSSTTNHSLRLDYRAAVGGPGLYGLLFPGGNPFSGAGWVRLALGLEPDRFSLFVDCEEAVVLPREGEGSLDLRWRPPDLTVALASSSSAGDDHSKFTGYLKTAEIAIKPHRRRPWDCPHITDGAAAAHPGPGPDLLDPLHHQGQQELQKAPPQRGVALGPPGAQQGGGAQRLRVVEQTLQQTLVMLDMLKAQNADLQARVGRLEGCECVRRLACEWEGLRVEDGRRWQTHANAVCSCSSGRVTCEADNAGCDVDGQQQNVTTADGCVTCVCRAGRRDCSPVTCPPLTCESPVHRHGDCCPSCARCEQQSQLYLEGEDVPSSQPCLRCRCLAGGVSCESQEAACPSTPCTHPAAPRGQCCPRCEECEYERSLYADGQLFQPPGSGPCLQCRCKGGNVVCHTERCPPAHCSQPIKDPQHCCPICKGCSYAGTEYPSGQEFPHPTDKCRSCSCINGNVQCLMRRCPPLQCSHPSPFPGECCPQCPEPAADCAYEQQRYRHTQRFHHPTDTCRSCLCTNGTVRCQHKPCPPAPCSHPITRGCCPTCEGCLYEHREWADGARWEPASDRCAVCSCEGGLVRCATEPCPAPTCRYPVQRKCCQSCEGCLFKGQEYPDRHQFVDESDPCIVCSCRSGEIACSRLPCDPPCRHPHSPPGQCCGECDRCSFNNVVLMDGQSIPDTADPCSVCSCQRGSVECVKKLCPPAICPTPTTDACGCPVCEGCVFQGVRYLDGHVVTAATDVCQDCTCSRGELVCERRRCPAVACSHPALDGCCPLCAGCRFGGREWPPGESFPHPSLPCQRCVCLQGAVSCLDISCPPAPCPRPLTPPGECCPRCTGCVLDGREYQNGQQWAPDSPSCSTCTCQEGEVHCGSPPCPEMPCMHQVQEPGACCPRCRGCVYEGVERAEGSRWVPGGRDCSSCQCAGGVTTCSQVRCLSPCASTLRLPGECCPVCADCLFEGRLYSPGDSFQPADDPCQICTCELMPDGGQHLSCYRKQCPSLVDCPPSSTLTSGPDPCCPVCAQPLSNCTSTLIGNEILATDDPCFTCQCKDLTWTCLQQNCPPLPCPETERVSRPDSCCPVCDGCEIEGQHARVPSGSSWTDSDDDCVTCTCQLGHIECSIEECPPLVCLGEHVPMKIPGKCCHQCQGGGCSYQGSLYRPGQRWLEDECTSCICVSGEVHCGTERCPALLCSAMEALAVVPGVCCPRCLPRPATCVAFGDPHYRTFDGRMLHFQGACTYVLTQDCRDGDFRIHVTNDDRGRKGVSWTQEVTVILGDLSVQLLQDWVVKVDGQVVTLPFLKEPLVFVERQTNTILLNTNLGLKVLWSGRSHLEVSVPGSYRNQTCGLCGDFNDFPEDDLRTASGRLSQSEASFGNSWQVVSGSPSPPCRAGEDLDPCREAGYQARKGANARCRVLKGAAFRACHGAVRPEPWHAACLYDLCACGADADECLCDALEAYAGRCREAGVTLRWRTAALCAVGCPAERGFVFDECGPPCPVTCLNAGAPLGLLETHCFKPCVPGCQCPAGLVLHNHSCIPAHQCPKIVHGNSSTLQGPALSPPLGGLQ